MERVKKIANEIFIEGLSGMATGLFATLIIGTIIQQIGTLLPGTIGNLLYIIGKIAASVTGVGIGCGVAVLLAYFNRSLIEVALGASAAALVVGMIFV